MENNVRLKISRKHCSETDYKGPKFLCTSQWRTGSTQKACLTTAYIHYHYI